MIEPFLKDDAFLADVRAALRQPDALHLWWLGQSGFLVQYRGCHLLLDPYLSDSLTRKYANTDKPHTRMTARVIAPERLDFIQAATSTHNHTDHLDAETLLPLRAANPGLRLVIPEANRAFVAERLGTAPDWPAGMDDGGTVEAAGFVFTGIASAHETVERDESGRSKYLGYVIQAGPYKIYHSGDTVRYDGMAERLIPHAVDAALLPINGRAPERRVAGNLWGREAAALAHDIGARMAVPCHYDLFTFNTATPDEFTTACQALGQGYKVLRSGERFTLMPKKGL
jgi:L-ascorbate metabolism protein UlaG (beta-lactamase superfamily)